MGGSNTHFYGRDSDCDVGSVSPSCAMRIRFFEAIVPPSGRLPGGTANTGVSPVQSAIYQQQRQPPLWVSDARRNEMKAAGWADEGIAFCTSSKRIQSRCPPSPALGRQLVKKSAWPMPATTRLRNRVGDGTFVPKQAAVEFAGGGMAGDQRCDAGSQNRNLSADLGSVWRRFWTGSGLPDPKAGWRLHASERPPALPRIGLPGPRARGHLRCRPRFWRSRFAVSDPTSPCLLDALDL